MLFRYHKIQDITKQVILNDLNVKSNIIKSELSKVDDNQLSIDKYQFKNKAESVVQEIADLQVYLEKNVDAFITTNELGNLELNEGEIEFKKEINSERRLNLKGEAKNSFEESKGKLVSPEKNKTQLIEQSNQNTGQNQYDESSSSVKQPDLSENNWTDICSDIFKELNLLREETGKITQKFISQLGDNINDNYQVLANNISALVDDIVPDNKENHLGPNILIESKDSGKMKDSPDLLAKNSLKNNKLMPQNALAENNVKRNVLMKGQQSNDIFNQPIPLKTVSSQINLKENLNINKRGHDNKNTETGKADLVTKIVEINTSVKGPNQLESNRKINQSRTTNERVSHIGQIVRDSQDIKKGEYHKRAVYLPETRIAKDLSLKNMLSILVSLILGGDCCHCPIYQAFKQ
ncbi:hypothetical protein G7084_04135 [Weissella coleopterorum]|uniref:Uncharacterized protein n=1 Tax=Weissella coleopterorum TaxID=2714949 RepID=A0A6G8B0B9_9LACO|nr:hypothetical protein [Weissella coleopterorum]QIL50573.1 hypothetical protein G7084_04135 [Weissella coleopterorum]